MRTRYDKKAMDKYQKKTLIAPLLNLQTFMILAYSLLEIIKTEM
jgi:hypothetical protein